MLDSNPIGPQKTKSQVQANQKKTKDDNQDLALIDEDKISELESASA